MNEAKASTKRDGELSRRDGSGSGRKAKGPDVTVITVVYSAEEHIRKTLESVTLQTHKSVEFIIVDGGSTDDTMNIIKEYDEFVDGWVSEPDKGIYDAMNKGIDMAEGSWLCFMNAGDAFYSDHTIEDVMASAANLPSSLFLYGGAAIVNEAGELQTVLSPLQFSKLNLNVLATRTMCHQSIFVAKSVVPKYSTDFRLKGELDWYYSLLRLLKHGQVNTLPFPVCRYSLGGEGDSNFIENQVERIRVTRKYNNLFSFVSLIPAFLIPFVFRVKRYLCYRMKTDNR